MELQPSAARVIAGRFHVLSPLGAGRTMLGRDTRTGATVAMRTLPAADLSDELRAALARQAEQGEQQLVAETTELWLIRPYVRGVPLSDRLERLSLRSCAALASSLLSELKLLHSRGLTHLNLHPGNVIVNADGPIRSAALVDGGLPPLGNTQPVRYGAPEQTGLLEDEVPAGPATDLYAAGLLIYESLAGTGPHDGDGETGELLRRRLLDDPTPLREQRPHLSGELECEVRRLIAFRPEARPRSAAEALASLRGAFSLSAATFIGRRRELERLLAHDRGLMLITGPAGSGKSRMLDELSVHGSRWVLRGTARELPRAPASALDEAVRALALRAAREPDFAGRLRPHAVRASAILPSLRGEFPPQGEADPQAVVELLTKLGEPVVLAIDDSQWADGATLQVIAGLLNAAGVAVVATARALPEGHPLMQVGSAAQIGLGALTDEEIGRLAPGCEGLARGNPGRAAIARDCSRLQGPQPQSAEELLSGRLALIPPAVRRTLAIAAVLGATFDPALLAKLGGAGSTQLVSLAEQSGLFDGPAFRDPMLREALLLTLGADERARLHRQAADAIRGRLFDRADHLLHGGERSIEVLEQLRTAGEAARARAAPDVAEHYLRGARKQVLEVAPGLALPVIESLAAVLLARGRTDLAMEQLEAALRLSRDPSAQARITHALGTLRLARNRRQAARVRVPLGSRLRGRRRYPEQVPQPAAALRPHGTAPAPDGMSAPGSAEPDRGRIVGLLAGGRVIAEARSFSAAALAVEDLAAEVLGARQAILFDVNHDVVGPPPADTSEPVARVARALARRATAVRTAVRPPVQGLEQQAVAQAAARHAVCVPVIVSGEVRAALYVSPCSDVQLAGHIAALAGAALQNIGVLEQLESLSRSLEERVERRTEQLGDTNRQLDVSLTRLTEAFERERRTAAQLKHQAFHDPLTDLANRALFVNRVDHALELTARRGGELAVLFVDLDDFKTVNDSLGHSVGDELLVQVAARLKQVLRGADTAARIGGDEFAILIEDVSARVGASRTAERVLAAISEPFTLAGKEVIVRASVGIALRGEDPATVEELLRNADVAMYIAKSDGKHRYEIFEPRMHEQVVRRLELKADLERAIEQEEFKVHYQPIVELQSGVISGIEALVRWQHRRRGLVAPLDFVPLAEETGLIRDIGDWVLHAACARVRGWQQDGRHCGQRLSVGVNLSARELYEPELIPSISQALRASGLPPRDLTLEITESVLMHDTDATIVRLGELRELGVKLAIDDFGTGYSSLGYLKHFPVDVLKIDKAFVDDIASSSEEAAVAAAIVTLSETLHMKTIAEGIEHAEQLTALRSLRCNFGQGYLFSRPVPSADMGVLLGGNRVLEPSAGG